MINDRFDDTVRWGPTAPTLDQVDVERELWATQQRKEADAKPVLLDPLDPDWLNYLWLLALVYSRRLRDAWRGVRR